jgi:hypothetical protein
VARRSTAAEALGGHIVTTATETKRWWHAIGGLPFAVFVLVACNTIAIVRVIIATFAVSAGGSPEGETSGGFTHVLVLVWEIAAALVLILSLIYWVRDLFRRRTYETAKAVSSVGLLMIVVLWFGWAIGVRGDWSEDRAAFPTAVLAILTLVLIHTTSQAWVRNRHGEGPPTGSVPKVG